MKDLISIIDGKTKELMTEISTTPMINIVGDNSSPFIRAIIKKCNELGIATLITSNKVLNIPTIYDINANTIEAMDKYSDIDCITTGNHSCCADAIGMILNNSINLKSSHVVIIGRGHSVLGLQDTLDFLNATVSVIHNETPKYIAESLIYNATAIVNAGPFTIDPSNIIGKFYLDVTRNEPNIIGKLTVSFICNRAVMRFV